MDHSTIVLVIACGAVALACGIGALVALVFGTGEGDGPGT